MTLRRRLLIASAACAVAVVLLTVVVFVQFWVTSASQRALFDRLAPAADECEALILAQTDAGRAVTDHLLLGTDASLAAYGASLASAESLLARLDTVITDEMAHLTDLQRTALAAQEAWVKSSADPALALMADDRQVRAARQYASQDSRAAYDTMIAASRSLSDQVSQVRADAANSVTGFTSTLGILLLVVGVLVVAGVAGLLIAVRQWILLPLAAVRRDLRRAARSDHHTDPIAAVGPPEIQAVAHDAETLRRELVHEIDEAVAAREGLLQDAPLVAAIEAELRGPSSFAHGPARVSCLSLAAEGVVAGDWCDIVELGDGVFVLVVADASGHGPDAGIAALRVRTVVRSGLLAGMPLESVADLAARACTQGGHFVTCLLLEVHPDGLLRWVNAGHHPALIVTSDKELSSLAATGPLLSVLGGEWSSAECQMAAGDVLVAFTDGLVEARTDEGQEVGTEALVTYLRGLDGHVRGDADETVQRVAAYVRSHSADIRRDDVTVVALSFTD